MAKFGVRQQVTVAEQRRSEAGANRDDEHHSSAILAGAEAHFGQPGHVGVVGDMNRATGLIREKIGHRQADKGGVDIGRRAGNAALDGGGKSDTDGTGSAMLLDERLDRDGDGVRGCGVRRSETKALARQFSGHRFDNGSLNPRTADIDAQNFHVMSLIAVFAFRNFIICQLPIGNRQKSGCNGIELLSM